MGLASDLIIIIIASLFGGIAATLLKQPLVLGYVLAGIIVGPYTGGLTVDGVHDIEKLAEVGVALLLFTLGLEFSLKDLRKVVLISLVGTPIQIAVCTLFGFWFSSWWGFSWGESVWIGALLSISSTMVVLKTLAARSELGTLSGKVTLGILIAQDLAIVPLILLLPQITQSTFDLSALLIAFLKSLGFLLAMYFAGTRALPKAFTLVTRYGSRELFFLFTIAIALGIGYLTFLLGLSFPFGAFIAGMVLSESDFSHQALSDVSGLRDLFGLLFFASVGMLLDPVILLQEWKTISAFVLFLWIQKSVVIAFITYLAGYRGTTPLLVGVGLCQVGEFAFAIGTVGVSTGNLTPATYSLVIGITILSMVSTPAVLLIADLIVSRLLVSSGAKQEQAPSTAEDTLSDHVVIIGGSTLGYYLGTVLKSLSMPFVIIDNNHRTVTRLKERFTSIIFGDAGQRVVLEAAHILKARLLVSTTSNIGVLEPVCRELNHLGITDLPIIARKEEGYLKGPLADLPVTKWVQPNLEAALEFVHQSLTALGLNDITIFQYLSELRSERYRTEETQWRSPVARIRASGLGRHIEFGWCEIPEKGSIIGASIGDLGIRQNHGLSIVAFVREDTLISNPGPEVKFKPKDLVAVIGSQTQIRSFQDYLNS